VEGSSDQEKSGEVDSSLFEKSPEQTSAEKTAEKDVSDKRTSDSLLNEAFFLRDSTSGTDNPFPPKSEVNPPEGSLRILGGKATIDYDQVMYLGRADAPFVVVKLFDYTCTHCRDMHGYLEVARRRYGGQLGIVLIPVPLNRDCNPTVRTTAPQHRNSCDYAKVALGVWKHRRDQFAAFHDWLFAPSQSHAPSKVKLRATQILGEETFENIAVDLEIARQLNEGVELYQTMGTGVIPKLIMGKGVLAGIVTDSSQLFKELETHLQIKPLRTE
jgi:protein-disulfide isomerase